MAQPWEGKKASESIYTSSYMMVTTLQSHCSGLPGAPRSGWRPLAWLGLPAQPRLQHALSPQQGNILLKMLKWKIVDCIGLSQRPPVSSKELTMRKIWQIDKCQTFFFFFEGFPNVHMYFYSTCKIFTPDHQKLCQHHHLLLERPFFQEPNYPTCPLCTVYIWTFFLCHIVLWW